jgi:hypothetical protein
LFQKPWSRQCQYRKITVVHCLMENVSYQRIVDCKFFESEWK